MRDAIYVVCTVIVGVVLIIGSTGVVVPQDEATRVLHGAGYSDVGEPEYILWGCEGDFYRGRVPAVNPAGDSVSVTVCCGFISKHCTIRH